MAATNCTSKAKITELHVNFIQESLYFTIVKRDGHAARLQFTNGVNFKKFKVVLLESILTKKLIPLSSNLKLLIMHKKVSASRD